MSKWNSEQEAREEIKGLVAEYYNQFKKPEQEKKDEEDQDWNCRRFYNTRGGHYVLL